MRAARMILGVLVLVAALLAAGCGAGGTPSMKAKFEKIDYEFSTLETTNSEYNDRHFERVTQSYIALVSQYAHQLGAAEARRRLLQKGDELSGYCLPCSATLETEATKY